VTRTSSTHTELGTQPNLVDGKAARLEADERPGARPRQETPQKDKAKPAKDKPKPPEPKDSFREVVEPVGFVVVPVLLLKSFTAQAFVIPTGSMAETL